MVSAADFMTKISSASYATVGGASFEATFMRDSLIYLVARQTLLTQSLNPNKRPQKTLYIYLKALSS